MDINFFPRSETDLAINIRKATSIGQSQHYGHLGLKPELGARLIFVRLPEETAPKRTSFSERSSEELVCAYIVQGNTSEHASCTHGTTSHPSPSGQA